MALALALAGLVLAVIAARGTGPETASAASHREAPLISLDGPADISDFFMFRSYEPGNQDKVVLVANVNPGAEPSSGPNYYNFDPSVTYAFHVDNDRDGGRTTSASSSSSAPRSAGRSTTPICSCRTSAAPGRLHRSRPSTGRARRASACGSATT